MKKRMACLILLLAVLIVPGKASAAELGDVLIPVTVAAEGAAREETYTVELEALTPGCPMPAGSIGNRYRMELRKTGTIRIPFEDLGVYDYRIRQIPGNSEGCTYDNREYRLRLFVTAAEDGTVVATALIFGQEGTKEPEALFRNYWAEPARIQLSALKTLDGRTPEDGAFSFRLISESGEILYEVENTGRHVVFPAMEFDRPGTWRFFLKEVGGSNGKIIYDRTVYTITVEVTLDGDYRAAVTCERNGKPFAGTPAFANYTDTGSPKTGDAIGGYAAMLLLSGAALSVMFMRKRRRK